VEENVHSHRGHWTASKPTIGPVDLGDAILLLRAPRLGKRGMILAAKLAAREIGPVVIADDGGLWDTDRIESDEERLAIGRFVREGLPARLMAAP
jgi:hypothetical protein